MPSFIERHPRWSLVQYDGWIAPHAMALIVNDEQVVGTHPGDVAPASIRGPNDATRIADRFFSLGLCHLRGLIGEMGIQIGNHGGSAARVNLGQVDSEESPREHRFKANLVKGVGTYHADLA